MDIKDRIFALADAMFPEQKDFAAALELHPSVVSTWRRGKSESYTKPDYMFKIAQVLGTTPEYLLTGDEDKKPPADRLADGWEMDAMRILRGLSPEMRERELAWLRSLEAGQGK